MAVASSTAFIGASIVTAGLIAASETKRAAASQRNALNAQSDMVQKEAKRRERELLNQRDTRRSRGVAVDKRNRLLSQQLSRRSKLNPRGGTILTSQSPFGKSLIGGSMGKSSLISGE